MLNSLALVSRVVATTATRERGILRGADGPRLRRTRSSQVRLAAARSRLDKAGPLIRLGREPPRVPERFAHAARCRVQGNADGRILERVDTRSAVPARSLPLLAASTVLPGWDWCAGRRRQIPSRTTGSSISPGVCHSLAGVYDCAEPDRPGKPFGELTVPPSIGPAISSVRPNRSVLGEEYLSWAVELPAQGFGTAFLVS